MLYNVTKLNRSLYNESKKYSKKKTSHGHRNTIIAKIQQKNSGHEMDTNTTLAKKTVKKKTGENSTKKSTLKKKKKKLT